MEVGPLEWRLVLAITARAASARLTAKVDVCLQGRIWAGMAVAALECAALTCMDLPEFMVQGSSSSAMIPWYACIRGASGDATAAKHDGAVLAACSPIGAHRRLSAPSATTDLHEGVQLRFLAPSVGHRAVHHLRGAGSGSRSRSRHPCML